VLEPGRIPGATRLLWTDVFETQGEKLGRFKPQAELLRLFGSAGPSPADGIVVCCFKGAPAWGSCRR
jgi:3-mercaptopyruvate sulfurtransferase SseA